MKAMSEEERKVHNDIHDTIFANANAKLGALLARRALDRAGSDAPAVTIKSAGGITKVYE